MCGITGWIDWEQDLSEQQAVLEEMACTLKERGPDREGYWLSPRAALAHRRLIVLDPIGGKQPMLFTQGEQTYALTYNGEIYNFRELREELRARSHVFRTHSDTEVLLHAYVEWGEDCVNHLNGIFAFAIMSSRHNEKGDLILCCALGVLICLLRIRPTGHSRLKWSRKGKNAD